ncbi:unnamed protein product [marine sediment metagenome]|uniref:Uncharacterized protein n=1 Tax=marine sediment metagenome TaxID=412755 RepID=X1CE36_9ZZZZ
MGLLKHIYLNVESYTALLSWIVVPLGFYALYLFLSRHYGIFAFEAEVPMTEESESVTNG